MSKRNLIMFIAITGSPTKEDLIKMMKGYKDIGINDVIIYPRTGLEVEYMSEGWREILSIVIDYAIENDMRIWLYDELNWPSGTCNSKVFYENDAFYGKKFYVKNGEIKVLQGGHLWDHSKYPFADCKNDLSEYWSVEENRFLRYLDPETGKVMKTLYGYDIPEDERCGGGDLFNPEGMKCFIKCTHQKYYEWFGQYFGTVIPGIFTDEPNMRISPSKDGCSQYLYYEGICQDYREMFGTDILEDMLLHEKCEPDNNFLKNYYVIMGKRFKFSFMDTIQNWCDEHNLKFTGHFVKDDSSSDTVVSTGEIFSMLDGFHIPGVDEIYTRLTYKESFLGLPATSGATIDFLYSQLQNMRRNGKTDAMVELFALGPYNMSFAQRSRAVWFAAAYGINHYFTAMGHMDCKGNYKRSEYYMNSSYALPDHAGMAEVAKDAELATEYADKTPTYTVSVRYPYSPALNNIGKANTTDYDFVLKECVEALGKNQVQWKLIREDEVSDTDITVSFGPIGILEENSGVYYGEVADFISAVSPKFKRDITVRERSGVLADDVFVRTYEDGSFIIINRSDENGSERDLILEKDGEKTFFHLYDFGVYLGEAQEKVSGKEIIPENVTVNIDREKRYLRCEFFDVHNFEFSVPEDITATMHICTYPEKRDVYINGKKLDYNTPETDFTDCFNPLYMKSEPILFEKTPNKNGSSYMITIPETDRAFLPMIILEGNIKWDEEVGANGKITRNLVKASDYINPQSETPFYNTASLEFDVTLPEKGTATVSVGDWHGLVDFKVNGELVEKKAMAPYNFEIPSTFKGDVHCEVVYYATYRALFADLEKAEKEGYEFRADWVKLSPVSSKNETVSFNNLKITVK